MVKPFLSESTCFFNFFSTIKVNLVAKIMQIAYFVLFFFSSTKKSPFLAVLTWFLILGKSKMVTIFGDVIGPLAAPSPIKYTSSCGEYQRLSTEGKIVSKYCNVSKTLGGGSHPPHPLVPRSTVGVWICMYVRGLITRTVLSENNKKNLPSVTNRPTLLCFALYRILWPLLFPDISLTHCSYEKTLILERESPSLPSFFFPVSFF